MRHSDIESHGANRNRVACSVVTLHAYRTSARTPQSTRARNYIVTPRVFNLSDAPPPPSPPSLSTLTLPHPHRSSPRLCLLSTPLQPCRSHAGGNRFQPVSSFDPARNRQQRATKFPIVLAGSDNNVLT